MKILIAIRTCHHFQERAEAQRATWVARIAEKVPAGWTCDVRFFLGKSSPNPKSPIPNPDEVLLDCADGYYDLPEKARAICRWAVERDYDYVFGCDDDVYVVPERLFENLRFRLSGSTPEIWPDYIGRLRGPSGGFPAPYSSGFATWLSRRAIGILAQADVTGHRAEDRWRGNVLAAAGIPCTREPQFVVAHSRKNITCAQEGPRHANDVIAACEFAPEEMRAEHQAFLTSPPRVRTPIAPGPFSSIGVLIKTFLRDGYLFQVTRDLPAALPGANMVIVDDGHNTRPKTRLYQQLGRMGHEGRWLPFDSGFGAKANAAIPYLERPYTLIGSDDFNFRAPGVADGILKLIDVLDSDPRVGSVAGQVNNRAYECFFERGADFIREIKLDAETCEYLTTPKGTKYALCDLTVNYNLVRTEVFRRGLRFSERTKMGADHFDFYNDLKNAGWLCAWCPGVSIPEFANPGLAAGNHRDYPRYRARSRAGIPGFLKHHGIKRYICMGGHVDELPEAATA